MRHDHHPPRVNRPNSSPYDSAGRPNKTTDPLNRVRSRTYTTDGLLDTEVTARGTANTANPGAGTIRHAYDDLGRQTGTSFGDGAAPVSYGYDPVGRTTNINRGGAAWGYSYHDDGTPKTTTRPDGSVETFDYDLAGRPKTTVMPVGTTSYAFDVAGNLLSSTLPNGTVESQSWDRAGQLTKIATGKGTATLVAQTITRDATNNPTQIVTNRGTATDTRSYRYDPNDRVQGICYTALTGCTGSSTATQWWTYDADGNRKSEKNGLKTGTTTAYTYDTAGQLTNSKTGTAAAVASTYDADGNQLTDGTSTHTYDLNHRTKTSTTSGALTSWQRDGQGNPLTATTGATSTSYSWDLNGRVPRLATKTVGSTVDTVRYDVLGRLATLSAGTSHSTLAHDQLGATTDVLNSTGVITRSTDWTPFGTPRAAIGAPTAPTGPVSPIGYAGMTAGPNTNSYLTRDRHYTPGSGRWTGTDPIFMSACAAFDSPYTYVGNRPGMYIDPLGQSWERAGNFAAGFGDTVRFGGTNWVREQMGTNSVVDKNSAFYTGGSVSGAVVGSAVGGIGIAGGVSRAGLTGVRGVAATAGGTGLMDFSATLAYQAGMGLCIDPGAALRNGAAGATGVASVAAAARGFRAVRAGKAAGGRLAGAGGDWPRLNEVPGGAVGQHSTMSCASACGEMLGAVSQSNLMGKIGAPAGAKALAGALGDGWQGGYVGHAARGELLERGPWGAQIHGGAGGIDHMVVVNGLDDAGNLVIRDPWGGGSTYTMTPENFDQWWSGVAVFR